MQINSGTVGAPLAHPSARPTSTTCYRLYDAHGALLSLFGAGYKYSYYLLTYPASTRVFDKILD